MYIYERDRERDIEMEGIEMEGIEIENYEKEDIIIPANQ